MEKIEMNLIERFEEKFEVLPESGCWIWIGVNLKSYAYFRINGKAIIAHRVSWEIYKGEIPDGINVLHHCDIRPCVNPYHLFLGTQFDNIQDRNKKNRQAKGELNGISKLTSNEVIKIFQDRRSQRQIAQEYHICHRTVGDIKNRKTWKHITNG